MKIPSFKEFLMESEEYLEPGHNQRGKDLSKVDNSITNRLEPLMEIMDKMSLDQLKQEFIAILEDPTVHASPMARKKYKMQAEKQRNLVQMMTFITNVYLKGSKLGLNEQLDAE